VAWLKAHRGATDEDTVVEPAKLPYPETIAPYCMVAVGGGVDFLMTGEAEDYDLPFKVLGLISYEEAYHRDHPGYDPNDPKDPIHMGELVIVPTIANLKARCD
jgi:hypothetical protein